MSNDVLFNEPDDDVLTARYVHAVQNTMFKRCSVISRSSKLKRDPNRQRDEMDE
jgi:hypothetical protein